MQIFLLIVITLIGSSAAGMDSFSAVKHHLQQLPANQQYSAASANNETRAIKSLMIHPRNYQKILGQAIFQRPVLPKSYISSNNHFKIHYTLEGNDKVDTTSTHIAGIPDYVWEAAEAAEYAYRILMDTLGFDPPPVDDENDPQTDIYIKNWGGSTYAYTYYENQVTSTKMPYDYTAYTVVDNDYSESIYTTKGLDGLRVTVVHEFFHVVQLGYNWWPSNGLSGSGQGDQYFLEWSSTWFEERAYPEVNDYVQYLNDFFYYPTRSLWSEYYSYSLGPFLYFLTKTLGEETLVRQIWEKIKTNYALQSLTAVIKEHGGDLTAFYNDFIRACYYTGSRYDSEYSPFPDGPDFPELAIADNSQGLLENSLQFQSAVNPLAAKPFLVSFSGRHYVNLEITAEDNDQLVKSYLLDKPLLSDSHFKFGQESDVFIGETNPDDRLLIIITNSNWDLAVNADLDLEVIQNLYDISTEILKIYANPYSNKSQMPLTVAFQIPDFIKKLSVNLYNLRGQKVLFQSPDPVDFYPGVNYLILPAGEFNSRNISSGVYILQLVVDGQRINRKFTILN
jgi:hypothetical protein